MFFEGVVNDHSSRKAIIGEFLKVDNDLVILKTNNKEIKVKTDSLEKYQSKYILVIGEFENGTLIEESSHQVEENFNFKNFQKLLALNQKFSNIF